MTKVDFIMRMYILLTYDIMINENKDYRRFSMKLQNNLSIKNSMFIKHHVSEFNEQQLEVLRKAIKHSVDITQYADPKYDPRQLNIIFLGLLNNIDVSYYADPAFSNFQMETIMDFLREYQGTPRGENVVLLAQSQYSTSEMHNLREYTKLPEAKELAKHKLPYRALTNLFKVLATVQELYDDSDFALDFAVRNIDRWKDNDNEITK